MRFLKVSLLIAFFVFISAGEVFAATYVPNANKAPNNLGLVLYLSMNEGAGTNAGDFSGNNNNTSTLASGITWITGRLGKALLSNGVSNIVVPTSSSIDLNDTVSLAFWIKDTGTIGSDNPIIAKNAGSVGYEVTQNGSTQGIYMRVDTSGGAAQTPGQNDMTGVLDGKWHHVVFILDNGVLRSYKDGVLISDTTYNHGTGFSAPSGDLRLRNFFIGARDEVRVYNRALSATEVLKLYKSGVVNQQVTGRTLVNKTQTKIVPNGLTGYWPFDGKYFNWSFGLVSDASGNGRIGTLTNMVQSIATSIGKAGQALKFDGINDSVVLTDNAVYDLSPAGSYTWSSWIKPAAFGDLIDIWASYDASVDNIFTISAHTTTDPDWGPVTKGITVTWANFGTGDQVSVHSNNNVLNTDTWSHVTVTYDGSVGTQGDRFKIYINGVDQTVTGDIFSSGTIGAISPDTTQIAGEPGVQFNGSIDEVRFYSRVLTKREIMNIFCNCRDVANE